MVVLHKGSMFSLFFTLLQLWGTLLETNIKTTTSGSLPAYIFGSMYCPRILLYTCTSQLRVSTEFFYFVDVFFDMVHKVLFC
jgi:hypothetical protein